MHATQTFPDYFLIWVWLLSQSIASKWPVMASFIHHDDTHAVWIANWPNSDSEHLVNYEPKTLWSNPLRTIR
ncbi:hypothetical protein B0T13DRAFT_110911 [Neurospora crassa]|nr:hypothetical protein B0T13DRAFT_110911 [Neurospora crassa]